MADQLITGTTLIEDKRSEKGEIWSIPGCVFQTEYPDIADCVRDGVKGILTASEARLFFAQVNIPNGAKITNVVVYGSDATETFTLYRGLINNSASADGTIMATANMNTEDTTISQATINNDTYSYWIYTSALDSADIIFGARIKYEF